MSVDERIRRGLIGQNTAEKRIDCQLSSSTLSILGGQLHFVPARVPFSWRSDMYKSKYVSFTASRMPSEAGQSSTDHGDKQAKLSSSACASTTGESLPLPQFEIFPAEQVCLTWNAENRCSTGVGLQNLGNTCFLNSILQVLVNTPPIVNYLASDEHNRQYCPNNTGFCAVCSLRIHIKRVFMAAKSHIDLLSPNQIVQKIRCMMKSHCWGRQEDAHEFLRYFVDAMQTAALLDLFTKETTAISRIFGGFHRSQIICNNCQFVSVTYDPFLDLSLEIKQWNSVESAMAHYTRMETLSNENAYLCPRCKKRVSARKILTIHTAPNVLTVHLKRFDHVGKIDRYIGYTERLNLRPYMTEKQGVPVNYRLYGVVVHNGRSTNSGHYYAFVRNPLGQWHLMDDSRVCAVASESPMKASAYLLFYLRLATPMATVKPQAKVEDCAATVSKLNNEKTGYFKANSALGDGGSSGEEAAGLGSGAVGKKISFKINNSRSVKLSRITPFKIKLQNSAGKADGRLVPYEDDTSDETATEPSSKCKSGSPQQRRACSPSSSVSSVSCGVEKPAQTDWAADKQRSVNACNSNGTQRTTGEDKAENGRRRRSGRDDAGNLYKRSLSSADQMGRDEKRKKLPHVGSEKGGRSGDGQSRGFRHSDHRHRHQHYRDHLDANDSRRYRMRKKFFRGERSYGKGMADCSEDRRRHNSSGNGEAKSYERGYGSFAYGPSVKSWSGEMNSVDRGILAEQESRKSRYNDSDDEDYEYKRNKKGRKMSKVRNGDRNGFQRVQDRRSRLANG